MTKIALFDLDKTLINGDSDNLWNEYLVTKGLVDDTYRKKNTNFYKQYHDGELDIYEFLEFTLKILTKYEMDNLKKIRQEFIEEFILPIIPQASRNLINKHKAMDHQLAIITATNYFIAEPIAKELGVETVLALKPEIVNNRYTGKYIGEPCFREGKILYYKNWASKFLEITETWFYSDSINDLPLLQEVDYPVAVNADAKLSLIAKEKNWQAISLT